MLQAGPDPTRGGLPGDDLMRDRPPRAEATIEAPVDPASAWLQSCLDILEEDPARADSMAQIRRSETTGPARVLANHCLGTAATRLGLWEDARTAFVAARDETPANETRARARFGAMAGNAALAGGDATGALALLEQAEADARAAASAPLEAIAATDRARALVALGRGAEALAPLDTATTLTPQNGEAWLLKATLLRRLERFAEAQTAIEQAARLAPSNPQVGLEAGVIAVLGGRPEAARASWQSVIELAPDTPFAATAKDYLAQLGPDPAPAPQPAPTPAPASQDPSA
ncbi:MAG: tetratricopeptide repeat protein [Porphyrobacter sp.]|nr:tetratricopeptide repeat protein [Porphyrobacter sp.]